VANLVCTATITAGCLGASRFLIGTPVSAYLLPTADDLTLLRGGVRRLRARVARKTPGGGEEPPSRLCEDL
jgi:hypothetical protein